MKTFKIVSAFWIVGIVLLRQPTAAQIGIEASLGSMYDDNVNNNSLQLKSNVMTLRMNGGYTWDGEFSNTRLFYDGSLNYYQSLLERTNHFHSGNLLYTHQEGSEGDNLFHLGGMYGMSLNRDSYTFYDHTLVSAFADYRYFVNDWFINKFGYTFRMLNFSSLSDFNYTEHALFVHGAFAATSSTTAIVQADLGTKFYTSTPSGTTSSMRKGMSSSLLPSVTQLIGMVKVGQRITEETGVSLTMRYQWNLQKQSRYLSSDYGFISDDELFDDHYGYEGLHTSLLLTQFLSESMVLKVTGGIQNKFYSSLPAYDLDGNVIADQRSDIRTYMNILFQKNFDAGFSLKAAYDLIGNTSNDAFYDYGNSAMSFEVTVPF